MHLVLKKTIYFRHALRRLDESKVSPETFNQKLNVKRKDYNNRNFILIAGHSKVIKCFSQLIHHCLKEKMTNSNIKKDIQMKL